MTRSVSVRWAASAIVALLVLVALAPALPGLGADHLDAPGVTSPGGRGDADINDVYVFEGRNASKTVLAMTVNPAAGALSPDRFATDIEYRINVDNDGDAVEDLIYKVTFFDFHRKQYVIVRLAHDADERGRFVAFGRTDRKLRLRGGGNAFAGLRSDPFFFDLDGFLGTVEGIGERDLNDGMENDPFATFNASAIVIEVKDSKLGANIGVWASTHDAYTGAQIDRMGRPAINTVVNSSGPIVGAPTENKNVYNASHPSNDVANFTDAVIAALKAYSSLDSEGAYADDQAAALAGVLLPDVITYDTSTTAVGPLNGRALADDVIDIELTIVTGGDPLELFDDRDASGAINTDGIGPHDDYRSRFPYLGRKHS